MEELKTLRHKQVIHPSLQEGKCAVWMLLQLVVYYTQSYRVDSFLLDIILCISSIVLIWCWLFFSNNGC